MFVRLMIDYKAIEEKWLKEWEQAKLFEAEPNDKESVLVTAAWPYTYMPQHIGHLRTYGTTDFYARYLRMKGFNVLFPMGWHKTGTPILAVVKRILEGDKNIREEYALYHIDWETVKGMAEPTKLVEYIAGIYREEMRRAGFSIDWRRNFTSTDPIYSKMVEWQFLKLKEKGLLVQGKHPVGWCPNEGNAIGQHDTKDSADPEIEEMTVIKFKDSESDAFFPCATYRPETVYGVTNLFVNDKEEYVVALVGNERMYLSKKAADALAYQFEVKVEGQVSAESLLKKRAVNPMNGDTVPVLPGYFVKADFATGVVMSVPAHAPFDYVALEKLKAAGIQGADVKPKVVVTMEGVSPKELPALSYLKIVGNGEGASDEQVEEATKRIYKDEQRNGKMSAGEYAGRPVVEARGLIKESLKGMGASMPVYVMANDEPVICRCGYRAVVKIVENQWFIDYGNRSWKEQARLYLPEMKLYPEKMRNAYSATVEWLGPKPMERAQGLGTRFPLNPEHIIEPLSDSTIYMAFYTFVNLLRNASVKPEQLKPEFFDFVLLGTGDAEGVAKSTGIDSVLVKRCRESFAYWYRFTSRHSAHELIPSHLTFYIYNHLAVLPKEFWPKQIVTNGMVNDINGAEMHKSAGNIVPLLDAIGEYGADTLRFIVIVSSDLGSDSAFRPVDASGIHAKNQFLYSEIGALESKEAGALGHIDYWLYSKLNSKIRRASAAMEGLSLREAYIDIYYNSINELRWYATRGGSNSLVLRDFLEKTVLMLAPAMPFLAEELWHMLGKNSFIAKERWPECDTSMISDATERSEQIMQGTIDDAEATIALMSKMDANRGKRPAHVTVILAEPWKALAYNTLCKKKNMGAAMADPALSGIDKQALSKFLGQFAKRMNTLVNLEGFDDAAVQESFAEAMPYMAARLGTEVSIEREAESKSQRAPRALPDKPSLDIRWE